MLLRRLRNVLAWPQSTQFKNTLSHIVKSITAVNMSSHQQQQLNGSTSNSSSSSTASAVPVTNGTAADTAVNGTGEVNAGDLVRFLELVGNLKVSYTGSPTFGQLIEKCDNQRMTLN